MERRIDLNMTPRQVIAGWPRHRPLMVLHSGGAHPRWARWTVVGCPSEIVEVADATELARITEAVGGLWIGYLGYGLGRVFEPAVGPAAVEHDRGWPLAELGLCPDALVYDNVEHCWYAVGETDGAAEIHSAVCRRPEPDTWVCGRLAAVTDPDTYLDMVARTIEYIAAGDIFQANITHRLTAPFEGSTRALLLDAMDAGPARYGAYLELPGGRCLLSLSPELFLDADLSSGDVVTRPVKGTRPGTVAPRELFESAKDAAELNMIVDLMRNDLGRVCEYGSVRVPHSRMIETHPTVHHGVGEVTGRLRAGTGLADLLVATFPPGSVTGAPKIRAMQIIDELEPVARGPYCGAIGVIRPGGRSTLNVAIRTLVLTGRREPDDWSRLEGVLDYGVGGGIVADSEPVAEYRESMDKAEILRVLLQTSRARATDFTPSGADLHPAGRRAGPAV